MPHLPIHPSLYSTDKLVVPLGNEKLSKNVRKWDVKIYVRFSWMAELKLSRFNKRTDGKQEASITCCIFSWKPHLTNERFKKTALRILEETSKYWERNILDLLHFSVKIPINKVVMVSYEKKAVKVLVSDFCKLTIFKSDSKWSPLFRMLELHKCFFAFSRWIINLWRMSNPLRAVRISLTKLTKGNIVSQFVGKSLSESYAAISIDQIYTSKSMLLWSQLESK